MTETSEPCQEVPTGSWQKPEGRQASAVLGKPGLRCGGELGGGGLGFGGSAEQSSPL